MVGLKPRQFANCLLILYYRTLAKGFQVLYYDIHRKYNAYVIGDIARPSYSKRDSTRTCTGTGAGTGAGTGFRIIGNANKSEGAKSKVDISTPNKTNKIPILISYQLNI